MEAMKSGSEKLKKKILNGILILNQKNKANHCHEQWKGKPFIAEDHYKKGQCYENFYPRIDL